MGAPRVHFAITIQYNSIWFSTLYAIGAHNYLIVLYAQSISGAESRWFDPSRAYHNDINKLDVFIYHIIY